jgi:hypothetical protein
MILIGCSRLSRRLPLEKSHLTPSSIGMRGVDIFIF